MYTPILTTKLYIPLPRPNAVLRSRLNERLNAGLHRKLTLICAPAGFGKTTLLGEWVAACEQPVAWLSLDEGHSDPTCFLFYLVAALQTLALSKNEGGPQLGEGVLEALQLPQPPSLNATLTTLLNEITTVSQNFILVLDDYHHLESQVVDQALVFLLEHLPPPMHLVIATREVPSLPLARLRARDHVTELQAQDLRFTQVETTEFLNRVMGLNLSVEDITALEKRTEGWIAGLQLAAISLQGHQGTTQSLQSTTNFIQDFSGSHSFVLDYLVEEVLQQQSEHIQNFLLCTSILQRFCGSLCDAILPQSSTSGQEILEYLERANLLLIPLDDKRAWYRYHHLFMDALQARLAKEHPENIRELHLRACRWYEQHNFRSEAIHHALSAPDFERAADLIEREWLANSRTYFQSATWRGWIQALPDALIQTRITLTLGFAWELLFSGELQMAEDRLMDGNRLLASMTNPNGSLESSSNSTVVTNDEKYRSLGALLAIAWAFHARSRGDNASTINHAHQALSRLSGTDHYIIGLANSLLGLAYWANGDLDAAIRYMSEAIARLQMTNHFLFAISGAYALANIKIAQGHLFEAVNIYKEALQSVASLGESVLPGTADLHLGLSKLYHEQGNVDTAKQHLQKCETLGKEAALPEWPYDLYLAQAQLKVEQGELDDALTLLEAAEQLSRRSTLPNVHPVAALKARVWLQQGRLAEALNWARERSLSVDDELSYLQEFEHITLARILIAQYRHDQADKTDHQAMALLARLFSAAEAGGRVGSMIEIRILQAVTHKTQGNSAPALQFLAQALTLAETEGYLRIFVNEGEPMAHLLYEALSHGVAPNYIQRVLAGFPLNESRRPEFFKPPKQAPDLIEPLSKRETEVLRLIANGLTNQEIATTLVLSLNTVKVHTRNIYGKLNAHHRTAAVAKARSLGILSST